jgi:hypothetical protein
VGCTYTIFLQIGRILHADSIVHPMGNKRECHIRRDFRYPCGSRSNADARWSGARLRCTVRLRDVRDVEGGLRSSPSLPQPIENASGALAVAFGAGYAAVPGLQQAGGGAAFFGAFTNWDRFKHFLTTQALLVIGALLYMAVGAAVCVTYVANGGETPGLVRTVAIAVGGYVIAYLGVAYRVWMQ